MKKVNNSVSDVIQLSVIGSVYCSVECSVSTSTWETLWYSVRIPLSNNRVRLTVSIENEIR